MRSRLPSARAERFAGKAARAQMGSTITIHRPTKPVFDATTGLITAADQTVVVADIPARIYQVSGEGPSFLGSEDTVLRSTKFSVMQPDAPSVHVGDHVTVVATEDDVSLVGREFRVTDVTLGGVLDPTRKITGEAIEPNQFWTNA